MPNALSKLKWLWVSFFVFLLICSGYSNAKSQWLEPHRVKFGVSGGFGGLHEWGKFSFDVHWWNTTFRVSPGVFYLSAGVTQKIYYFKPRQRRDRVIILSAYYHKDYFLTDLLRKNKEVNKNIQAVMIMPGFHIDLNYTGTWFLQVSAGYTYAYETLSTNEKALINRKHHHLPMAEIRIGGIFLSRKMYHQKFPQFDPAVHKIKKVKLKFKK